MDVLIIIDYDKLKIAHELIAQCVKKKNDKLPSDMSTSMSLQIGYAKNNRIFYGLRYKGIHFSPDLDTLIEIIKSYLH